MKSRMNALAKFAMERRTPIIAALIVIIAGIFYAHGRLAQEKDVFVLYKSTPSADAVPSFGAPSERAAPEETPGGLIIVYITGEVVNPGIYEVDKSSRVNDVLILAGGGTEDADLTKVNLASPLADGAQITVPKTGEDAPEQETVIMPQNPAETGGPVNINTADAALLETLPGVGPATAKAIVDYRTSHGAFKKTSDLKKVSGIGDAKYALIKDLITVN